MSTQFAADRFVYSYSPDGHLSSGAGTLLDVYVDQACTTLAVLTDLSGISIPPLLTVGDNSLLPEFLDTQDHTVLYVRARGTTSVSRVEATLPAQVDHAMERKASLWTGTQAAYDALGVYDPQTIYVITG